MILITWCVSLELSGQRWVSVQVHAPWLCLPSRRVRCSHIWVTELPHCTAHIACKVFFFFFPKQALPREQQRSAKSTKKFDSCTKSRKVACRDGIVIPGKHMMGSHSYLQVLLAGSDKLFRAHRHLNIGSFKVFSLVEPQ